MKKYLYLLAYFVSVHLVAIFLLNAFRFIQFLDQYRFIEPELQSQTLLQAKAFLYGLWFDNVIGCYILVLPLAVASFSAVFNYFGRRLYMGINAYLIICYTVVFAISAANIPYFEYFSSNINASIFNWTGYTGTTLGMVFGESSYYFPILYSILFTALFFVFIIKLDKYFFERISSLAPINRSIKRSGIIFACTL